MGQCYNSVVVNASVSEVWATIKNFHEPSWGDKVITKVDIVGDTPGTEVELNEFLTKRSIKPC